ncbi:MAG: hypothetical protein WEE89_08695 [Gemmatimonadota bacterium]
MVDLPDEEIAEYLDRNVDVVRQVVRAHAITVMQANHLVLMSVVAQRVSAETGVPYVVMPHGSALEYAVKKDLRFHRLVSAAVEHAKRVLVSADELGERVLAALPNLAARSSAARPNAGANRCLFSSLTPDRSPRAMERAIETAAHYDGKRPDADAESRLRAIDWVDAQVLIFAASGLPCCRAAWSRPWPYCREL